MKFKEISLNLLELNVGQIEGLPGNPRKISAEKLELLKKDIQDYPELLEMRGLIVYPHNEKFVLIGGNMRYRAMLELGYDTAPCIVVSKDASVEKLKAYTILDNAPFGEWDWEALSNDWDEASLIDWGLTMPEFEKEETKESAEDDDFDEAKDVIETRCQTGDLWLLGEHRLLCGDSTKKNDVARLMDGERASLWITDPPYNVAVTNSKGMTIANDNMSASDFYRFLEFAFASASSFLVDGCPFYVWFASKEHINFETALNAVGLMVRQELIWNKNAFILGRSHYQWKHEPCLYGWKGDVCKYFTNSRNQSTVISDELELNIDKMKKEQMRDLLKEILSDKMPTSVIDENKPLKDEDHPTMKPVRLFGYLIANSSQNNDIVLDNFGGSGTTLIACEQLGRKARLIEIDPHYCDLIIARWEKYTGKTAEKI